MPPSKLKRDTTAVRRTKLLALRRQGVRYDDDRILNLGYASASAARRDLHRTLEIHRNEEAAEVSIYRQQENERLDALLEAAWRQATEPQPVLSKEGEVIGTAVDMRAVDTVLRLMDRRAKLNGLDMPVKAEVSGPGGGAIPLATGSLEEMERLFGISQSVHERDDEEPDDLGETDDDHDR